MITKRQLNGNGQVRVTFTLPQGDAAAVQLLGDFTEWRRSKAMKRASDGTWRVAVDLPVGREYGFRYLVDGVRWENDPQADKYVANPFGSDNSVVVT
jgi:1,4-alpha-glucan branching enzyme